ncbi:DUF6493 family protein [Kineosporia babensis]|uniref:DUF6493 family protein n=1 Tax=Kineosporia babensis TaxID=499548 RepID=A0A9X1NI01_9ACTN|nr:DUF6493 family protein [Kineosporia babensis]MCD5315382.1 DUF6493 family protein [Kineosporia babensis]
MDFDELLDGVRAQELDRMVSVMIELTDEQRRALAPQMAAFARTYVGGGWSDSRSLQKNPAAAVAAAIVGTLPASKLPAVLRRLWVSIAYGSGSRALADHLVRILQARGLTGNPKLADELARRVRDSDLSSARWFFELARQMLLRSTQAPQVHPAFVRVWITWAEQIDEDVRARPDWAGLAFSSWETRGTGARLSEPGVRSTLLQLSADGLIPRTELLEACVGALQATDRKLDLRGLVDFHEELAPSLDEIRAGHYVSLLAGAPAFVAMVAQQHLQALDAAGRLQVAELAQASEAVLVRPDKGLFRAQLGWLRAALKRNPGGREPLARAVAVGFGHPDPALQKSALELLAPYVKELPGPLLSELSSAAAGLAPDLHGRAAGLFGAEVPTEELGDPELPLAQPAAPLELLDTPEEAAEVLAVFYQSYEYWMQVDPQQIERMLEALVRWSWSDPEHLHRALAPLFGQLRWLQGEPPPRHYQQGSPGEYINVSTLEAINLCLRSAQSCAERPSEQRHRQELDPEHLPYPSGRMAGLRPGAVLNRRIWEVASGIRWAPVPVLLATPSTVDGVIEGEELRRRLLLVESAGCRPWLHDLIQAWLRVCPAERDGLLEDVRRVAGPENAEHLVGLSEVRAEVRLEGWTQTQAQRDGFGPITQEVLGTRLVGSITPDSDTLEPWNQLWHLPAPDGGRPGWSKSPWLSMWPSLLPFEPDITAAHLSREDLEAHRGAGEVVRLHAEAPGPAGAMSLLLYCYGLNLPEAGDRAATAEGLIALIGRGDLDAGQFGALLGHLITRSDLKLNRVVETLQTVGQAGAWSALRPILVEALARCLPTGAQVPPARLADLVALAVEAVHRGGSWEVGEQTDLASRLNHLAIRKSASRLRTEARRLQAALAPVAVGD